MPILLINKNQKTSFVKKKHDKKENENRHKLLINAEKKIYIKIYKTQGRNKKTRKYKRN